MRIRALSTAAVVVALLSSASALAHDNSTSLMGIGFDTQLSLQQFTNGTPGPYASLSVKLAPSPRVEFSGLFGFAYGRIPSDTRDQADFTFGVKGDWVVVPEPSMNLYLGLGVGVAVGTLTGLDEVTYFIGPGVEFFLPSLPHLGFFTEFGLGGNAGGAFGGQPIIGTYGSAVANLGLHYYF